MSYSDDVAMIHNAYPGRDVATCQAAIAYLQGQLAPALGKTGDWKQACTDCLAEYQKALNGGTSTVGAAVLSGGNVSPSVGVSASSGNGVASFSTFSPSTIFSDVLTNVTQNPIYLVVLGVVGYIIYKKRKSLY